jgi:hypothetical protein
MAAAEAAAVAAAAERDAGVYTLKRPLFNRFCVPSSSFFLLFPLLLPLLRVT